MNVDITNHLLPWTQVKRMLKRAWGEGYEAGADDTTGQISGETLAALTRETPNPYQEDA